MEHSSVVQLQKSYLNIETDEEIVWSDDSEVSVADMTRRSDNVVPSIVDEIDDGKSSVANIEDANETTDDDNYENDDDNDDEYVYSEESICSNVSCRNSDMTNVTPRSSTSLEFPSASDVRKIAMKGNDRDSSNFHENREKLLRICSSATDNRYSINNDNNIQRSVTARTRRRNMSFTNFEMQKIERDNQFLLKKIMAQKKPPNKLIRVQSAQPRISSSAINRKKLQRRIEEENMLILRKIQGAKSCANKTNATPGYRVTSL